MMKLRLSRLLCKMGYFVRRSVPVSTYVPGEYTTRRVDITDIDVLGVRWDEDLAPDRLVCECKSGSRVKPLDRCFWLGGVMRYFEARKGYLLVREVGTVPGSIGQTMSVLVIDEGMLSDLEKRYNIDQEKWVGYSSPGLDDRVIEYRKTLRQVFRPQLNYLVYGYWKDPEYYQVKRLLATSREVAHRLQSTEAMRWLSYENLCLLTSSLVSFCHGLYTTKATQLADQTSTRLFGGFIPKLERENIAKSAIKVMESYVEAKYSENFPLRKEDMKLDPEYMDKLVELLSRLVNRPNETRMLPSFLDLVCFEFLHKGKPLSKDELNMHTGQNDVFMLAKLAKNVVSFYLESTSSRKDFYDEFLNF
jgi:hypothetical protein